MTRQRQIGSESRYAAACPLVLSCTLDAILPLMEADFYRQDDTSKAALHSLYLRTAHLCARSVRLLDPYPRPGTRHN